MRFVVFIYRISLNKDMLIGIGAKVGGEEGEDGVSPLLWEEHLPHFLKKHTFSFH